MPPIASLLPAACAVRRGGSRSVWLHKRLSASLLSASLIAATIAVSTSPARALDPAAVDPAASAPVGVVALDAVESEAVSVTAPGTSTVPIVPGDTLALIVPRNEELSSEFTVGADGRVALPSVGRIELGGLSIEEAEDRTREAVGAALGLDASGLLLTFAVRRPVLVLGDVEDGGAVPFTDGMVAIEAIALAGGPARSTQRDATIRLESARIAERIATLRLTIADTLVAIARLDAEAAGEAEFEPPAGLDRLTGDGGARMVRDQRTLFASRAASLASRQEALAAGLVALDEEIDAIGRQLAAKERELANVRTEVETLAPARDRGLVTGNRFLALDRRVAEVEGDIAALFAQRARAKRERIAQEDAIDAAQSDFRLQARQGASDLRASRANLETQLEGAIAQLGVADGLAALIARENGDLRAATQPTILRRGPNGLRSLPAGLATPLLPGDVLSVPRGGASALGAPRQGSAPAATVGAVRAFAVRRGADEPVR